MTSKREMKKQLEKLNAKKARERARRKANAVLRNSLEAKVKQKAAFEQRLKEAENNDKNKKK